MQVMKNKVSQGITTNVNRILLLALISSLIAYVIFRAYHLSFTHDECLSYQIVKGDDGLAKTANNHFVNTWLMSFFSTLFGASEGVLRMPNVLAFVLYSLFTYKLLIKVNNIFLMLTGAALLLLNPYLIDFFCLARGYGLSLGFGMAALYYFFRQEGFTSYRQFLTGFTLALVFSLLSAASNLICINLNIALVFLFLLEFMMLVRSKTIQLNGKRIGLIVGVLLLNFLFLSLLIHQLFLLKDANQLYFGRADGFIESTLTILLHRFIYLSYYGEQFWIYLRQVLIVIYLLVLIYQIITKEYSRLSRITLLLTLMIFASILQYYVFDSLYPTERTSLIFIPLFGLFLYYLIVDLYSGLRAKRGLKLVVSGTLCLMFFVPMGWHFVKNINLKFAIEWKQDAHTKDVMRRIRDAHQENPQNAPAVSISNTWVFEPAINYYRDLYEMDYLNPADRLGVNESTEYIYCSAEERGKLSPKNPYHVVSEYEDTQTVLLKK